MFDNWQADMQVKEVTICQGERVATCRHGLSPAIDCLQSPHECYCGYAEGLSKAHYPVPAIRTDVVLWDNNGNGTLFTEFNSCCLEGYPRHMTIMAERMGYWDHVFDTRDALRYMEGNI